MDDAATTIEALQAEVSFLRQRVQELEQLLKHYREGTDPSQSETTAPQTSIRDSLTGLFTRDYLMTNLQTHVDRMMSLSIPVGVIQIDIDHFKLLRDMYGDEAGNEVLRAMGEFLRRHIRGEDTACRFGEDRFTLILPGASLDNTYRRAERLCLDIKKHIPHPARKSESITLSIGVAGFPDHGTVVADVLDAATRALGRAQRGSANRVMIAENRRDDESGKPHRSMS